jgi:glycosyltransferase involved in cell wall biosynthesis
MFSVILPTRNRPTPIRVAVESILGQSLREFEIIIINDGSDDIRSYAPVIRLIEGRGKWIDLPHTKHGHGKAYAVNRGAERASGAYLCFLDDDDFWTDMNHLQRAQDVITCSEGVVDLYLTNQIAMRGGQPIKQSIWIEDINDFLASRYKPDQLGSYTVGCKDLMRSNGFSHMNTTIIRRKLFESISGLDEANICYEVDLDFYLRAIDAASLIKLRPARIAQHNVPDPVKKTNMSTRLGELEKRIAQLRNFDRAIMTSKSPHVRRKAKSSKAYILKHIAERLHTSNCHLEASYYAREALLIGFSLKWLAFTLLLMAKALVAPSSSTHRAASRALSDQNAS